MSSATLRFAPSPNGFLHLGHAYSALLNARTAARLDGRLLLRIEDIDVTRCRPAYDLALREDLAWLGIAFTGEPLRQGERLDAYAAASAELKGRGLLYPCRCSRSDIRAAVAEHSGWPHDPDGAPLYPGTCRTLTDAARREMMAGAQPVAWRLDMERSLAALAVSSARSPQAPLSWRELTIDPAADRFDPSAAAVIEADPWAWGDPVLIRKEFPASYHLAVVLDDAFQQIDLVVRGLDLYPATSLHRLLQALLGLPSPRYHHHKLIKDTVGLKLSKSLGSTSLRDLRARGMTPTDIRQAFGFSP